MYQVSADEAKERLAELIDAAVKGETVLITRNGDDSEQAVQLVPAAHAKRRRKAGSAQGLIVMSEDFDAPLADFEEHMP
ncbi:MAG TPA: type II toxin-antitoxin system prevent-host-death family antitoxin [Ktedonobacterales bacterium]|jgi:prevent-host-death family protein|nr:type II toxin-antitoxin system prevent-host-death family antitoxin [Ktedonobacterales bacterium]